LACVLVASVLDGITIPLIERSVNAIQQAAPRRITESESRRQEAKERSDRAEQLKTTLDRDKAAVEEALAAADAARESISPAAVMAKKLDLPVERVQAALDGTQNRPSGNSEAVAQLGFYSLLVVAVFFAKYWFTRGQALYLSRAAIQLAGEMRVRLYEKLQRLPVSYFGERRVGGIQSVLTNDVNVYQSAVGAVRDSIDAHCGR
jgi:ABC-type multidrug transport system fused ATPase/permease subunit